MSDYPVDAPNVEDLGLRHFVMPVTGARTGFLWWHDCTHRPRWGWIGHVNGRDSGHQILSSVPLDVGGSLICDGPDGCGDHGFIRNGKWVPA